MMIECAAEQIKPFLSSMLMLVQSLEVRSGKIAVAQWMERMGCRGINRDNRGAAGKFVVIYSLLTRLK